MPPSREAGYFEKQSNTHTNNKLRNTSNQEEDSPGTNPSSVAHVIVDFERLKTTIDKHLTTCFVCGKGTPTLSRSTCTGFATRFIVSCGNCEETTKRLQNSISYLSSKMKNMTINDDKSAREKHTMQMKLRRKKIKLTEYNAKLSASSRVEPLQNNCLVEKKDVTIGRLPGITYDLNLRSILCAFYLGTSGYDVERMSTFVGFHGGLGFERLFYRNIPLVIPRIKDVCNKIIHDARLDEIRACIKQKYPELEDTKLLEDPIEYLKRNRTLSTHTLTEPSLAIIASYDMGWSKRSSGRHYDSMTGHGFLIGGLTKNVIAMGVMKKKCRICLKASREAKEPPVHSCQVNHFGSSGAMESSLALKLTNEIYEQSRGTVHLGSIVTDDDSTLRSQLQNQVNGGKLIDQIPQPKFLADPSHRIKVMIAPIFKLVSNTKDPSKCKNLDALRLKKYIGCYIAQSRLKPLNEFVVGALAPVEHLFNSHTWCDASWCWAKNLDETTHTYYTNLMQQSVSILNVNYVQTNTQRFKLTNSFRLGTRLRGFYRLPKLIL